MAVVMSVLALAGCGTKKEETITLTLWHSFGSTVSQDVIDDYIEMYEKEHPNIKIVQETAQIEEYQFRKLKVAVANNSQGDVFLSYGGGYSKSIGDVGDSNPHIPLPTILGVNNSVDAV